MIDVNFWRLDCPKFLNKSASFLYKYMFLRWSCSVPRFKCSLYDGEAHIYISISELLDDLQIHKSWIFDIFTGMSHNTSPNRPQLSVFYILVNNTICPVAQVKNPGITFDMSSLTITMKPINSISKITPGNSQFSSSLLLYQSLRPYHLSLFPKPLMCRPTFTCAFYGTFSKQ